MNTDLRMAYLRALFRACPAGQPADQIALAVGQTPEQAAAALDSLWREGKAARVPNSKTRGYLWRTPMAGDDAPDASFLFEHEGQPMQVVDGVRRVEHSIRIRQRLRARRQG